MKAAILFFQDFTICSIVIRLIMATVFGGVIGLERATRHHTAGIRTFALVSLGSALASVVNIYMAQFGGNGGDMSRIPAQVVSGIGFLGVGTIIVTGKNQVKGLTTAATLWVTAMMGIAIGAGMFVAGVSTFILIIVTVIFMAHFSHHQEKYNRFIDLYLEVDKTKIDSIYEFARNNDYELCSVEKRRNKTLRSSDIVLLIELNLKKRTDHAQVLAMVSQVDGVHYMEEL